MAGGADVVFNLYGVRNPPTVGVAGAFIITVQDCEDDVLETASITLGTPFTKLDFTSCLIVDLTFIVQNAYKLSWTLVPTDTTGKSYKRLEKSYTNNGWSTSTHRFCIDQEDYTFTGSLGSTSSSRWDSNNIVRVTCQGEVVKTFTSSTNAVTGTFDPSTLCSPTEVIIYASDVTSTGAKEIGTLLAVQGDFRPSIKVPTTLFTDATKTEACTSNAEPPSGFIETITGVDVGFKCKNKCCLILGFVL